MKNAEATLSLTGADRLSAACRCEPVDATPVWFMRQAGRCLAEHRELRKRYDYTSPDVLARLVSFVRSETAGSNGVYDHGALL